MLLQKIIGRLRGIWTNFKYSGSKRRDERYDRVTPLEEIPTKYPSLGEQYNYFHHFFWNLAPQWLRDHRDYFRQDARGFGEDAFHSMWYLLFENLKPAKVLEIGVYRGQTISLWGLLAEKNGYHCEIHGISPFSPAGDHVSVYLKGIDYHKDVVTNCGVFNKKMPILHKGYSTDQSMIDLMESIKWDIIYIDGNHDYEIVVRDFNVCSKAVAIGGLIVLDDSSLYTSYKPASYSTAGHPGPSRLANEIDKTSFAELLSVGHNRVFKRIK